MDEITSFQNLKIKNAKKLHDKKHRDETGLFFFEGVHLLEEFLGSYREPEEIFVCEDTAERIHDLLSALKRTEIHKISRQIYSKITAEQSPQGVFCVCRTFDAFPILRCNEDIYNYMNSFNGGAIILDSIRDPGNVGTVIRTAVSLGMEKIIISADSADIYNPKTLRATMGALFVSDIAVVSDLPSFINCALQHGINVYASLLDETAAKLTGLKINPSDCFVVGNEGSGISEDVKSVCSHKVFIPMSGKTESLNVSAAAAIIMWEYKKNVHYDRM